MPLPLARFRMFCLTAILFATAALPARAQSVGMSDEKRQSLVPLQTVVTYGDTGTVLVLLENPVRPTGVSLLQLDTSARVAVRREVPLGSDVLPEFYEAAFAWGDRLTLLTSLYYPGPQRNYLIARQYSLPGLEEVYSRRIDEVYMPPDLQIPFGYSIAPDGEQLLLYGWSYTGPTDSARLSLTLLDRQLQTQSDREVQLPYTNQTFQLYGALLAPDGGVYALGEDYKGNPQGWSFNASKMQPSLLYLPPGRSSVTEYLLQAEKKETVTGLRIRLAPDGILHGAGFYQRRNRNRHEGLFTFTLNGPARSFQAGRLPIGTDMYRSAGNDRSNEFRGFAIDELWWADGSLVWAAEQTLPDPTGMADLAFGNLLVGRLDGVDRLAWLHRLPRAMSGAWGASSLLSFRGMAIEDQYQLVYGGSTLNYPDQVPYFLATFDAEGLQEVRDVTTALRATRTGLPQPMLSFRVQQDRLLVFGVKVQEGRASSSRDNTRFLLQMLRAGEEYSPAQLEGYLVLMPLALEPE